MLKDNNFYEIEIERDKFEQSSYDEWRAWTGRRFMNGEEYHGPIFLFKAENLMYKGRRICPCKVCQATIDPAVRVN